MEDQRDAGSKLQCPGNCVLSMDSEVDEGCVGWVSVVAVGGHDPYASRHAGYLPLTQVTPGRSSGHEHGFPGIGINIC